MKYHNITVDDMLNGDGLRVVLWVAGCEHHCPECHNPITWDPNYGIEFDEETKKFIYSYLEKKYISGITFSGGDPFHPNNRLVVGKLINDISNKFPSKTIWVYTGYLWEEINNFDFIKNIDVIVDGKFVDDLKDVNYHWAGSTNQRVIDVKESLKNNTIKIHI